MSQETFNAANSERLNKTDSKHPINLEIDNKPPVEGRLGKGVDTLKNRTKMKTKSKDKKKKKDAAADVEEKGDNSDIETELVQNNKQKKKNKSKSPKRSSTLPHKQSKATAEFAIGSKGSFPSPVGTD